MIYLLKDGKMFALVSDTGAADGWYTSLAELDLTLPSQFYHKAISNVLEAIQAYRYTIVATYSDILHFKLEHPELFI
jgi:hypothetical protein